MSGSIENYDGLCGIIDIYSTSDIRIRCKYELGHSGPHSYEVDGKRNKRSIQAGLRLSECIARAKRTNSPAAWAILSTYPDDMEAPSKDCWCAGEDITCKDPRGSYCKFIWGHGGKHSWEK